MTGTKDYRPVLRAGATLAILGLFLFAIGCVEREVDRADVAGGDTTVAAAGKPIYGADPIENGRISFNAYCASCHGREAKGDGPVAASLNQPPSDLTRIMQEQGGRFVADSVYAVIDGRHQVQAHGSRDMPVWGNIWIESGGRPVLHESVDLRINELVEYVRSLQVGTEADSSAV